jgi:hypothetical protein
MQDPGSLRFGLWSFRVEFMPGSWKVHGEFIMVMVVYKCRRMASTITRFLLLLCSRFSSFPPGVPVGPAETPNFTIRHALRGRSCIMSYRLV